MRTNRRYAVSLLATLRAPALRWPWRVIAVYLSVTQFIITQPLMLGALMFSVAGPSPKAVAAPSEPIIELAPPADVLHSADGPILLAQNIVSNRQVPVDLPVQPPIFSTAPTEAEILTKGGLQEPLFPVGEIKPTAAENKALSAALASYRTAKVTNPEDVSALAGFLSSYPNSPWRAALLTNIGLIYRQTGYFTKALASWEEAYSLASAAKQQEAAGLADRALSELAELNSRLGRQDQLKSWLEQATQRQAKGSVANRIDGARTGLGLMQKQPGTSFKCGPYALERILASQKAVVEAKAQIVHEAQSTAQGTSLSQVAQLSRTLGMNYQMVKREPGSAVIVPAVVNWKAGHYAALIRQLENGKYWVEDPTFGSGMQVSQAALDAEGSGYFLVPAQQTLPNGWHSVGEQEGQTVWGKGQVTGRDDCGCGDSETGGNGPSCAGCAEGPGFGAPNIAMPGYSVYTMAVSLHITDSPVGYIPPVGPSVYTTVSYNQYEANQLSGFQYANFGPLWNSSWLAYIIVDPNSQNAYVHTPGGGTTTFAYSSFNSSTTTYGANQRGQSTLQKVSATNYIQHFPDGSSAIYSVPDASGNVFYKQGIDAKGNAVTLHYAIEADPNAPYPMQLSSISDAMGQVTQFSYELPDNAPSHTNKYLVTKVTDPFLRSATFGYTVINSAYQLTSITDVIGMTSTFGYQGSSVNSLTTPYGTTAFTFSSLPNDSTVRVLEVADPYGAKERWESWINPSPTNYSEPVTPTGMNVTNMYLYYRNTFYWDKKAMVDDPSHAYTNATIFHWLHTPAGLASHTLESIKRPRENRVWFNYPGQSSSILEGTSDRPTAVGRVLDNGDTQLYQYQYSADNTEIVKFIDPSGRTTFYDYDTNGIDLLTTKQSTGTSTSVVLEKRIYDINYPPHCPKQVINASGRATTFEYDGQGRVLTATNAKSEKTTYSYTRPNSNAGPIDGYLYSITGPVSGATSSYTYDALGRLLTSTDSENYTVSFQYDSLNRVTKTTYFDAASSADRSYTQNIYDRLDVAWTRNRLGKWTHRFYDSLRHLVAEQDPLGRITNYGYCLCGAMTSMTDAAGNVTQWAQDIQGRKISKTFPDGSQTVFSYENTTSRLKAVTDALGQSTGYTYYDDNNPYQTVYTGAAHSSPTVTLSYDPVYNRVTTMVDGTGTITYGYGLYSTYSSYATPVPITTGAGMITSESKAGNSGFASYAVTYGYDEIGRENSCSVDGSANQSTIAYDTLGRVSNVINPLGNFGYDYISPTSSKVSTIFLGNESGLRTSFVYDTNLQSDRRLLTINNLSPSGANISRFDQGYDAMGNVIAWTQQADSQAAQKYNLTYDAANQLVSALLTDATPNQSLLKTYTYGYDSAANRTSVQNDSVVTKTAPNPLNQITSTSAGGLMRFAGILSEPATVTVGGNPAQVNGSTFAGYASVAGGTNTVPIVATNRAGLTTTNNYQVQVSSPASSYPSYDSDGNMTNDGIGRTFEWDAANRLTAINYTSTSNRSELAYDGMSRCMQITEKSGGNVVSVKSFVWCGGEPKPCEERNITNGVVKRFYTQGEQINGSNFYALRDHLGSLRELTDNAGVVHARYSYDAYGQLSKISGDVDSDFGFTSLYFHQASGLHFALRRAYDAGSGRWLSRDPIGERGGINLYAYCFNDPVDFWDPSGNMGEATAAGTIIEPGGGTLVGLGIDILIALGIIGGVCVLANNQPKCAPCVPPVGSIAYRVDMPPSPAHNGIPTPHSHQYQMNQSPPSAGCKCFWSETSKDPLPGIHGPAITPAGGGGVM